MKKIKSIEFQGFMQSLKLKTSSQSTVRAYESDIALWLDHFTNLGLQSFDSLTPGMIRAYFEKNMDLEPTTVQRKIASLKAFLVYLVSQNKLSESVLTQLPRPKAPRKSATVLPVESVEALTLMLDEKQASVPRHSYLLRDYALLETLYCSGVRASEVVALNWANIDFVRNQIYIVQGKGGKDRVVPLLSSLKEVLIKLKEGRRHFTSDALFLNQNGGRLTSRSVQNIVKKYAAILGLGENVTPHVFRHSFASHLLGNGAGLRAIQELLGHESLSTTQKYTHIDEKTLTDEYDKLHPLSKK